MNPLQASPPPADVDSPRRSPSPLFSVIVPTFNSGATLDALLRSLSGQAFRDFEVIVCDGGSTDATLQLAHQAASGLPGLRIDSRADAGVYDAINRGIAMSHGQWVLILGSDDRLHADDTLARAASALSLTSADMVYGDVRLMAGLSDMPAGARYAGPMSMSELLNRNICQQAVFYRRVLFTALGPFDTRYRICADWDFNLRVAFRRPIEWIDLVVADYAATGMSARGGDKAFDEDLPVRLRKELLQFPQQRALWPLHRHLLRHVDTLRRRRRWREAFRQFAAYLTLSVQRLLATRHR